VVGDPAAPPGQSNIAILAVLLAAVAALFVGIGTPPLHDPDEGRYAEIAREMVASGDWLTPHHDGIVYFEKPPLFFWLAAASIRCLGATEVAARLPGALAAVVVVLLTLRAARSACGPRTGATAALLLATSPMVMVFARIAIVDMVLCALLTSALAAARDVQEAPERRGPALRFWGSVALAFVCKGPIGVAIPVATLAPYVLLARDYALPRSLARPSGPLLFLALTAPWYIAMEAHNPGYLRAFFLEQNLDRLVAGERFDRDGAVWYYLPVIAGLLAPWTLLVPSAIARIAPILRRAAREGVSPSRERSLLLFACAVLGPLSLLSVAHSKLVYYALPLFPPLAIVAAEALVAERTEGDHSRARSRLGAAFLLLGALFVLLGTLAIAAGFAPERVREAAQPRLSAARADRAERAATRLEAVLPALAGFGACAGGVGLAAGCAGVLLRRGRRERAILPLALALAGTGAAAPFLLEEVAATNSARDAAAIVKDGLSPGDAVVLFYCSDRTLPFYLERTVTLFAAPYSEFGRKPGPEELRKYSLEGNVSTFAALWASERRVVAITEGSHALALLREAVGTERARVLGRARLVTVIENRPAQGRTAPAGH